MVSRVEGWTVSPRKSRKKSACFSRTSTSTPARASRKPSIMPAGPPPTMQQQNFSFSGSREPISIAVLSLLDQPRAALDLSEVSDYERVLLFRLTPERRYMLTTPPGQQQSIRENINPNLTRQ